MKIILALAILLLASPLFATCNPNSNGGTCNTGTVGPQGPAGQDGVDGKDGTNGTDGVNGTDAQSNTSAQLVLDTALRIYDGKRIQLQIFNAFGLERHHSHGVFEDGKNVMFGARILFKLGPSYEEKQLKILQDQIAILAKRGVK